MRSATALTSFLGTAPALPASFDGKSFVPPVRAAQNQRTRIWEMAPAFHCSIVGTCLTNADVRHLLRKLGDPEADMASEHKLHVKAVSMASRQDISSKLLNKALDQQHDRMIRKFGKAKSVEDLRTLWDEASAAGDIASGYWAVLSHPAADKALCNAVFGEVHMLSHLVGRASRVDLQRLRALEAELELQKARIAEYENRVRSLTDEKHAISTEAEALRHADRLARLRPDPVIAASGPEEVELLRRKLADERARSEALAERHDAKELAVEEITIRAEKSEKLAVDLEAELLAAETVYARLVEPKAQALDLKGQKILYLGGRPKLVEQLRLLAGQAGGTLLSHDGGIEDARHLLSGQVAQADVVVFPVDCVSHYAMGQAKRLCQDMAKPFIPLRTASMACFLSAVSTMFGG